MGTAFSRRVKRVDMLRQEMNGVTISPMNTSRKVNCPTCGTAVPWSPDSHYRPFCSARCRKADLGAWANDEYKIPAIAPGEGEEDAPED